VGIVEELVEIWPNEVCDRVLIVMRSLIPKMISPFSRKVPKDNIRSLQRNTSFIIVSTIFFCMLRYLRVIAPFSMRYVDPLAV